MKKLLAAALICCILLLSACASPEHNTAAADSVLHETPPSLSEQQPPAQTEASESGVDQSADSTSPDAPTVSQHRSEKDTPSECREPYCTPPEEALSPSSPPESVSAAPEEPVKGTTPSYEEPKQPTLPTEDPDTVSELDPSQAPQPAFDINVWVAFAQTYGGSVGLTYDATATECWDNPIIASDSSIYLERDIKSRLDLYAADGIIYFCVWAHLRADGRYDLYIGYA